MKEKKKRRISHPAGFTFRCDNSVLLKLQDLSDKFGLYKRDIIEMALNDFYSKHIIKK